MYYSHSPKRNNQFVFLETPTGYMSEDGASDMSGDQLQNMQTGLLTEVKIKY